MTKRRILLKTEIFILIFAVLLGSVTFVMRNKNTAPPTVSSFYKEPINSLDVIFLGSSHMLHALYPLQLYHDYGMASYNYSQYGQPFLLTYKSLKEVLKRQKPKIVVIDIMTVSWLFKTNRQMALHNTVDGIPYPSKYFFINDLAEVKDEVNLFELYFPMYLYHSKWNILQKNDFSPKENYSKGITYGYNKFNGNKPNVYPIEYKTNLHIEMKNILDDIINLTEAENISLIFTVMPYDKSYQNIDIDQKYYNDIYWLTRNKKNVDYINYFHFLDEVNFDFSSDLIDDDHLNYYGAQKITAHLGKYIKEHYDIPDRRLDPAYAKWNDDYRLYVQDNFAQELNAAKEPRKYSELLASKKEVTDNTCILIVNMLKGSKNRKYIQSLGLDITGSNYIAILDSGKVVYQQSASDVPLIHEYKIGKLPVKLVSNAMGTSSIKIDGIEQIKNKPGVAIVIYDKLLKKVTSVRCL